MLTEEQKKEITMFMRVATYLQKNEHILESYDEFKNSYLMLKESLQKIFSALDENEKDELLELFNEEVKYLELDR